MGEAWLAGGANWKVHGRSMVAFGLWRCSRGCLVALTYRVQWKHGGIVQRGA